MKPGCERQAPNDSPPARDQALPREFPELAASYLPDLQGIVWFQGWNDGCDDHATAAYREKLVRLVLDLPAEFGDATLPFVVVLPWFLDHLELAAVHWWDAGAGFGLRILRSSATPQNVGVK